MDVWLRSALVILAAALALVALIAPSEPAWMLPIAILALAACQIER